MSSVLLFLACHRVATNSNQHTPHSIGIRLLLLSMSLQQASRQARTQASHQPSLIVNQSIKQASRYASEASKASKQNYHTQPANRILFNLRHSIDIHPKHNGLCTYNVYIHRIYKIKSTAVVAAGSWSMYPPLQNCSSLEAQAVWVTL